MCATIIDPKNSKFGLANPKISLSRESEISDHLSNVLQLTIKLNKYFNKKLN